MMKKMIMIIMFLGAIFTLVSIKASVLQAEENVVSGGGCELNGVKSITPTLFGGSWYILCNCSDHLGTPGPACEIPEVE